MSKEEQVKEEQVKEEQKLFENDRCTIRYDDEFKVRIDVKSRDDAQLIVPVNQLVMDLNNMPVTKNNRRKYGNDIKNIYQMALNQQQDSAIEYANKLMNIMENNLLLKRKIEYTVPATISYLLLIILSYILQNYFKKDIFIITICSSLGGILSLLLQQNKIEIDYKVDVYIIIIESLKRVIITVVLGTIGYIAIKANVIFSEMKLFDNKYVMFLVIVTCGYSSTFIPNVLDSMLKVKNSIKVSQAINLEEK